ncbi:aldo/keto reductase [Enterovibrio norvegicus FF-33]|uniref:Aldo/keto reductase n=1 Tax=Enterovibrio norvegicus FF-454 TaxID=1185651 RepID=A0A1E5C9Q5_9GAMM|nr:aldo/keto reductase [Enterovibrio norvegicus]OEE62251.1 aldo/keto reductase [Enterovibrio norvegicus FF-454]OEE65903.1 aldo/keto reductase [Enterovibrio norvegicus FF-33]
MFPIILGTAKFGTYTNKDDSFAVLDAFLEMGGSRLDTANNYACWHPDGKGDESETVLGQWLQGKDRKRVEVMTKIGAQSVDGFTYDKLDGLSPDNIKRSLDKTLTRLNTDYLDVLYAHVDDLNVPLLDTWKTLSSLVDEGIVRQLGISNYKESRVLELVDVIEQHQLRPFDYAQYRYSIISPNAGADFGPQVILNEHLFGALKRLAVKPEIIGYSPLLDGCYEFSADDLPENYDNLLNCAMLDDIQAQAEGNGSTPSALVLKTIADYGITPVTAASTPERLKSNLQLLLPI